MRKLFFVGAAGSVLLLVPLPGGNAVSQSIFSKPAAVGESSVLTLDSSRGVLTMAPLLERVSPAVVSIRTGKKSPVPEMDEDQRKLFERLFDRSLPIPRERRSVSVGSGVIVDAENGYILTNNHVVDKADEIFVTLTDRREFEAELVGGDDKTDIAVLKVDADNLRAIRLAQNDSVKVGDYVIAVGNPFGLGHTVTSGIVSALGREFRRSGSYEDFIQTDAAINPGNSGGALVNSRGELIGINSAIISRSGGNNGIGLAVPTKMARGIMDQLVEFGEVRRGRIGVLIRDITPGLMEAFELSTLEGALVNDVVDDSPADKAGLQPGDIIIGFNSEDIRDASDIRNAVGLVRPGTAADLVFLRDDRRRTVRIEVGMFEEQRDVLGEGAEDDIPAMESFSGASITGIPDDLDLRGGDSGVYVESVRPGSRAARSGLATGDIIRKVDKTEVASLRDFEDAIRDKTGPIALTVERDGTNLFLAVQ